MAEPPAKRARRTDSAAMWDRNGGDDGSVSPRPVKDISNRDEERQVSGDKKATTYRHDERRRSRERFERRRDERSRSRERAYRDRDHERSRRDTRDGHDRRDRERRSRSRERYSSKRDLPIKRERDRSRSPIRNGASHSTRTRSPPKAPRADRPRHDNDDEREPRGRHDSRKVPPRDDRNGDAMQVDPPNGVADEDEDAMLRRVMGFSAFNTTQNKKVPGNDVYGVRKEKQTKYRQYMNRTGGFNRPLSPSRDS